MRKIGTNLRGDKICIREIILSAIRYSPIWVVSKVELSLFGLPFGQTGQDFDRRVRVLEPVRSLQCAEIKTKKRIKSFIYFVQFCRQFYEVVRNNRGDSSCPGTSMLVFPKGGSYRNHRMLWFELFSWCTVNRV